MQIFLQELSRAVSFVIFGHQTWDLEGGSNWPPPHILVFKYPSRDIFGNTSKQYLEICYFLLIKINYKELNILHILKHEFRHRVTPRGIYMRKEFIRLKMHSKLPIFILGHLKEEFMIHNIYLINYVEYYHF